MKFRKLALTLHLYLGLMVGMLLAVIALTGSLLVFGDEIEHFLYPQLLQVIPQAEKIPLETVLQIVQKAYPQNQAISILLPRGIEEVCQVSMLSKSEELLNVYVNPYTGIIQGSRLWKETFTGFLFTIHAELAGGELGHIFVGFCGILTLILALTGLFLWTGWRNFERGFLINWKVHWQRSLFDLHNFSGIASVAYLLLIAATGTAIIFYVPFEETIYRLTNEKPQPALVSHPPAGGSRQNLDEVLRQVDTVLLPAKTTFISLPSTPEATFKVRKRFPNEAHPNGSSTIYLDQYSGEILRVDSIYSFSLADRILNALYPLHIGSYGGILFRVIHAITGLLTIVLFVSGLVIWRQRYLAKLYRDKVIEEYKGFSPVSQQWPWF
ncbi:PepSY domain-containing protein [Ancylothrix sp. C2]|uniref:PepSY-associated TM helix domain-containing protein n=1 Tax=Ancylothrix sp. D3o TaxID=2953691 RepID=UPI0021BAD806|nr:PepSY-associated TM helix domain-containing protein [Ancylothrix sp. D3o]MCT7952154.1 PepSY domain-containing protein [Ancylothrix sp. D3o]